MNVQINTGSAVDGRQALISHVEKAVRDRLARFESRLTRVEVHIGDENGPSHVGEAMRCVVEARPMGREPVTVTDRARSIDQATKGALDKMVTALDTSFGKLTGRNGH